MAMIVRIETYPGPVEIIDGDTDKVVMSLQAGIVEQVYELVSIRKAGEQREAYQKLRNLAPNTVTQAAVREALKRVESIRDELMLLLK